jgi:DMSO/TMAO reductase YedYZ molybdopterin-dependent catalytic subunit
MNGPSISRRRFLRGAASLGGLSALGGCNLQPSSSFWDLWSKAEGVWSNVLQAGPLKNAMAKTYPISSVSTDFPIRSLNLADGYAASLPHWELKVEGLIPEKKAYTMAAFKQAFPRVSEITRHDCVEGWSAIAEWTGIRLRDFIAEMKPTAETRYVVFYSADADESGSLYYGSLTLEQALHPQTLLAYEMNGQPLPLDHGAPLRLKVPTQLGYKSTKFINKIAFVSKIEGLNGGKGGYWEDAGYEHYAGI